MSKLYTAVNLRIYTAFLVVAFSLFLTQRAEANENNYSFELSPIGLTFNAVSQSVGLGFIQDNQKLILKFHSLSGPLSYYTEDKYSDDEQEIWKDNGSGESVSLSYQLYHGNFFIRPSLYYRDQKHINNTRSKVKAGTKDKWVVVEIDRAQIEDVGLSFSVGNEWNFSKNFLSVEWIGLNRSLHEIKLKGNIKEEDLHALNFLNIYVGLRF